MNTKQKLENDLKTAMREKNKFCRDTIRMALTSIKLTEVDQGHELDESTVLSVINKELKNQQEALENAKSANRIDLIDEYQAKINILNTYLPEPYSEQEIINLAKKVIDEIGAKNISDVGNVMKTLMPLIQGRARGDQVSYIVKQLLQVS